MIGIQITSNKAKFIKQANATASVFRRVDVQASVKRNLGREMRKINKEQFAGEGIGPHGKWKKLAPATIKQKGHSRILVRTGHLFRQVTRGGSIKAGFVSAFNAFTFHYTIKTKPSGLLRWLQKGTKGEHPMPARQVIDPNKQQEARLTAAIWDSVVRAYRKIGWFDKVDINRG